MNGVRGSGGRRPEGNRRPHPAEVSFRNLMAHQAMAALRISGAQQSQWNGYGFASNDGTLGTAHWNGSISYDGERIIKPLRQMMFYYGQQHDIQTLQTYRQAVHAMLHENSHMFSRADEARLDSARSFNDPSVVAIEEGVTDAWTQDNLNRYIHELGLERVAPGISRVGTGADHYPQYTPAARALCDGLSHHSGVPAGEIMRRLNNESASGKWPAVADLVMDSSGLRNQIPQHEQAAARDRIQQVMQSQFKHLPQLVDRSKPMDQQTYQSVRLASAAAGQEAVRQAHLMVIALREEYPPQPQQDRGVLAEARQTMSVAQDGIAPINGSRPIDPVRQGDAPTQPLDGARQVQPVRQGDAPTQQIGRVPQRTGPGVGD